MRLNRTLHLAVTASLLLSACTLRIGSPTRTNEAPAPTTLPLPATGTTPQAAGPIPAETPVAAPSETPAAPAPTEAMTAAPASETAPAIQSMPAATNAPATQVVAPENPISLPPGFGISVFAQGLQGPRMMTVGPDGMLYVAERGAGRIVRLPDRNGDGVSDGVEVVAENLRAPDSLAFYKDGSLYVGSTTQVVRLSNPGADGKFQKVDTIVPDLPSGGHGTRTVLFSPDFAWLFVSVGSSCNVCNEQDPRRAAILRFKPDGSEMEIFAKGLRNAVGITFKPGTDELWATNNGRDNLGDDQPPETIYQVQEGQDYGWPRCHSGRIVDPDFGSPDACQGVGVPVVEMQAHSAPLGLNFYSGQVFPTQYQGGLFVAFHGSWNRSVPTGYKVVFIPMSGGTPGPVQDFTTGWLKDNQAWSRPVDVKAGADGSLYVSDDSGGYIYRIFYTGP